MLQLSQTVGLQVFPQGFTETVKQIFTQREEILAREAVFDKSKYPPLLSYLEAVPIISINDGIINEKRLLQELSKDGSLFQSPSATARAFMLTGNESCRIYLESMVKRCGHGVPCTYPIDEQVVQLCMVDHLERLGLAPHFSEEIQHVLGNIYRDWIKCKPGIMEEYIKPEQIYKDSLAFRLFRMHGYHVSPWKISWILQQKNILVHMEENYEYFLSALLSVYKATNLIFPGEDELEEIRSYSRKLLEKGISTKMFTNRIDQFTNLQNEIGHELGLPWLARLDYLEHRMYIEESESNDLWMGKAPFYRLSHPNNTGLRQLARENYSLRQLIYKEELEELKRWSKDSGLLEMGFAREKTTYCYFAIAASTSLPYLSDIRKIVVKSAVLITIIDDLFDMEGSLDELYSFTEAVKRWDAEGICGRNKVIFDALDDLVDEISLKFFDQQGWDITNILRDIWYHTFLSWLKEAEWSELGITPSIEEYIEFGMTSIAVHTIILPIYYLITQDLTKYMMHHSQYETITKLLMVSARLLNDLQSYKKEMEDGKKNLVILYMMEKPGSNIEEAINYIRDTLNEKKKELLQNILLDDMSNMPKQFKQLHLSCLKVFQMFFNSTNGYDSETEFLLNIKKAIYDPLKEVKVQISLPLLSANQHEEPEMGISREKPQLTRSFNYSHVGKKASQLGRFMRQLLKVHLVNYQIIHVLHHLK